VQPAIVQLYLKSKNEKSRIIQLYFSRLVLLKFNSIKIYCVTCDPGKGPSIKDIRTKSWETDPPPPLSTKCPHWLNSPPPLSVRTHHKLWKLQSFRTKVWRTASQEPPLTHYPKIVRIGQTPPALIVKDFYGQPLSYNILRNLRSK